MKSILTIIGVAFIILLPLFASFSTAIPIEKSIHNIYKEISNADNITITIKGGFGCTVSIQNNENYTIKANVSIICHRIFREGGLNSTGKNIPIEKEHSFRAKVLPPGIDSVYAMAQVGNQTVTRKGISIFYFVVLFKN